MRQFHVEEADGVDTYRVPGKTKLDLEKALALLEAAEEIRAEQMEITRDEVVRAMFRIEFDPTPQETVEQARRLAAHRQGLLASGAFTIKALRTMRGDARESATRTWLTRRRQDHALFTVERDGTTYLPAFELSADGELRGGVKGVLDALVPAGFGGWELWTWFASPSTWLDGRIPAEHLDVDPDAVASAAQRVASNLAEAG